MVAVTDRINKLLWALFLPYLLPAAAFSGACFRVCERLWNTPLVWPEEGMVVYVVMEDRIGPLK